MEIWGLITKKNRIWRSIGVVIGAFMMGFIYNAFLVPNNLVYGGIGGLAILINDLTGIEITLILNIVTFSLIIISFILLGAKMTSYSLIGYVVYIMMVNITSPLAKYVSFEFDSFLLATFVAALIFGFGNGILYRMGFNTGGADSIVEIIQHYLNIPRSKISTVLNTIIILLGTSIFGIEKTLYAIVFLKVSNFISDHTILGKSDNKICYIKSHKIGKIEDLLRDELGLGYSILESTNGIGFLKKKIIFCVLPTEMFYDFKQTIMKIDSRVILISNNCYTVEGGTINSVLPV